MLPPKPGSAEERRLARLFRALGEEDRRTLLAFAAFLAAGGHASAQAAPAPAPEPEPEPVPLPRPEGETVIAAIRRLSRTYAMLDRGPMLHETSALMSAHVLQGREAAEVIEALEALFLRHYQDHRARRDGTAARLDDSPNRKE
jgi:hypothetical protein